MSARDAFIEKMKQQLDDLNVKMDELEIRAQKAKKDVNDQYREEMAALRRQSALAIASLDEIRIAGEDSWETLVAEMEKARDAFVQSFHNFKSGL